MLEIFFTAKFKKDAKRVKKRGKNISKLEILLRKLVNEEPLESYYRDHALVGNYADHRECHIESDWLLIYRVLNNTLRLERTGTHSDLF